MKQVESSLEAGYGQPINGGNPKPVTVTTGAMANITISSNSGSSRALKEFSKSSISRPKLKAWR
ncbi:MAG: hypothetical protein M0P73_06470 [Syntrophobacterales bacterium]|jgi:hypothetical protein|nr:hypothetical protein [Syntrophobacterales bacterium]